MEGCWIQKKIHNQDKQGKLGLLNPAAEGFCVVFKPRAGLYFFSARLWPGSHQALVALQQHHTTNGWPWGDTVSCLGARKRVDVTFGFCSFDTLINPYSINKWKFTYKKTHPTLSILILWFANQNKKKYLWLIWKSSISQVTRASARHISHSFSITWWRLSALVKQGIMNSISKISTMPAIV